MEPKPQTIRETRLANCKTLIAQAGNLAAFGERIGMTNDSGQLSNTFGPSANRQIGEDLSKRIEESFGKPRGWLDMPWGWIEQHFGSADEGKRESQTSNDIDALRYVQGAMLTVMAGKRPAEGRAVEGLLLHKTPKKFLEHEGAVTAALKVLKKAVSEAEARKRAQSS